MGLDQKRFTDPNHILFECSLCNKIAVQPTVLKCCEAIVCTVCHAGRSSGYNFLYERYSVEGCDQYHDKGTELVGMQKQLKLLYSRLKVKCLNKGCIQETSIEDIGSHEENCLHKICPECNLRSFGKKHDCFKRLKGENKRLNNLLDDVKKSEQQALLELAILRNKLDNCTRGNGASSFVVAANSGSSNDSSLPLSELDNSCYAKAIDLVIDEETTATEDIKTIVKQNFLSR